ncbi:MAG: hypothetical protein L0Z50_28425 [Verrucomicrobiales bacterium]|nr:hypothetical protein [Verrucomicrobiales bacterium]
MSLRDTSAKLDLDRQIYDHYDSVTDAELAEERLWGEFAEREFAEIMRAGLDGDGQ